MQSSADTIAALSTPPGRGAVCVVRISGPAALDALKRICRPVGKRWIADAPRVAVRATIVDGEDGPVDDGLVLFFPGPASYTGEDCAEIQLHGSPLIARQVMGLLSGLCGIRPALAGEFTQRAFRNGKMDLTQAESIRALIDARSEYELNSARRLYSGELKRAMSRMRSSLIGLKAEAEAEVDFSDEDLTFESREMRAQRARGIREAIQEILSRSGAAQRVGAGFRITLAGATNAGKSSLLNRMLGWDRSIVSDVHGTTRDYVAEDVELGSFRVRFIDTAGLRETNDAVEREGIRRSLEEMRRSQVILHVVDLSRPAYDLLPELDEELRDSSEARKIIHVLNKSDSAVEGAWDEGRLSSRAGRPVECLRISCQTGEGIDHLRSVMLAHLETEPGVADPFLLEERHRHHLAAAGEALERLLGLWQEQAPEEIAALEINEALAQVGAITGEVTTEEVLGRIFSTFCVGK